MVNDGKVGSMEWQHIVWCKASKIGTECYHAAREMHSCTMHRQIWARDYSHLHFNYPIRWTIEKLKGFSAVETSSVTETCALLHCEPQHFPPWAAVAINESALTTSKDMEDTSIYSEKMLTALDGVLSPTKGASNAKNGSVGRNLVIIFHELFFSSICNK